jgi:hypothetical protein
MTQEIQGQTFHHLFFHGKMLAHIFSPSNIKKMWWGGAHFCFSNETKWPLSARGNVLVAIGW